MSRYEIVCGPSAEELVQKVNELMGQGWFPFGVLVIQNEWYFQPMILQA